MIPSHRLEQITQRFQFLEASMADGAAGADIATLAKEYSDLKPVVDQINAYRQILSDMTEAEDMLADPDMEELAREELPRLKAMLPEAEDALQLALLPKDAADAKPAMLEIRPGTGGDEAALFAADLFRMYQRYAEARGWKVDIIEEQITELGGLKEIVAHVKGVNVFARLKYESGVHRVQRVPSTESQGRIHTSAATVAVLPEAEDVDIKIDPGDLRIDTTRASGPGGQHVNTTDSAVRITHFPRARWSPAPRNPNTATARSRCRFCARVCTTWNARALIMNAALIARRRWGRGIAPNAFAPIISRKVA